MSRIDDLTAVDSLALKRADEALEALHYLEVKFFENGYVKGADLELMRGAQYNLEAVVALFRRWFQKFQESGGPPLREE